MQSKESYINKLCNDLNMSKKDLSIMQEVTLRTIDNWSNNENSIPNKNKIIMNLMLENNALKIKIENIKTLSKNYILDEIENKEDPLRKLNFLAKMI